MAEKKISGLNAVGDLLNDSDEAEINQGGASKRSSMAVLGGSTRLLLPNNVGLSFSVASNALTIALKTAAGNDPSPASPVSIPFRNVTAATGTPTRRSVLAANSLVISSGSTLGTANSTPFRLWIVAFDDGGTVRLGVINCLSGVNIYPLAGWAIGSSTAEGGAGAADSAQVFYTGTAVSNKPYVVLGYATWETGLATAGTWSGGPTRAQLFGPDAQLPGCEIQSARSSTAAVATGSTQIPTDDTIPQNTEGDQYLAQAITPRSAANILRIGGHLNMSSDTGGRWGTLALFQDSISSALAAASWRLDTATANYGGDIEHELLAGTTSTTTFKVRMGADSTGTNTINGQSSARKFGGAYYSWLRVSEIMA
jgi:hypothetical protein